MTTYVRPLPTAVLLLGAIVPACAPRPPVGVAPIAPALHFRVLGNASPSDSGAPTLRLAPGSITIRGMAVQVEGAGLYGDLDVGEPATVRLTLYDSLPGRPVHDPPPRSRYRQVIYQADIGPLAPGPYQVWIGRFDAAGRLVEVAYEPLRIEVEGVSADDSVSLAPPRSRTPETFVDP